MVQKFAALHSVDWFGREVGDAAAISNFHMLKPLLRGKDCPHAFDLSTLS